MTFREERRTTEPVWSRGQSAGGAYERHSASAQPPGGFYGPYGSRPAFDERDDRGRSGGPQHTTIIHSSIKPVPDSDIYKVGIYGWRKRCLYVFLTVLTLILIFNLCVTVWIMSVLNFSLDGMGAIKVENDGIRVTGKTKFEKSVQFSQISTENNEALTLESALGVTLNAHNHSGDTTASFDLNQNGKVSASCERFEILDRNHKLLFFADSREVGLKLDNLRILDDGGSVFEGAVQTAVIRPEPDMPLAFESPTRNIKLSAGQDIELLSSAGEFSLNTLLDINFSSKNGDIKMDGNIYMTGLERSHGRGIAQYQLCVCQNGRLFMAVENADCRADKNICDDSS